MKTLHILRLRVLLLLVQTMATMEQAGCPFTTILRQSSILRGDRKQYTTPKAIAIAIAIAIDYRLAYTQA